MDNSRRLLRAAGTPLKLNRLRQFLAEFRADGLSQNPLILEIEGYTIFNGEIPDGLFRAHELPQNDFFVLGKMVQKKYGLSFFPRL